MMEILPLLVFTTCSGLAAGAYAVDTLCLSGHGTVKGGPKSWFFPLTCLILLAVGLLATLMHLGQPLRFINGMANPGSMISQESYWAIAFGVVLVVDTVLTKMKGEPNRIVRWVGTVAAFGLMIVTSIAYFDAVWLPAWNTAAALPFFVLGDLAAGAALVLFFAGEEQASPLYRACIAGAIAWGVSIVAYWLHLGSVGIDGAVPLCLGLIIGPGVMGALSAVRLAGKVDAKMAAIAVLVAAVIGLVIVRIVFFASGLGF